MRSLYSLSLLLLFLIPAPPRLGAMELPRAFWRDVRASAMRSENPELRAALASLEADEEFRADLTAAILRLRRKRPRASPAAPVFGEALQKRKDQLRSMFDLFEGALDTRFSDPGQAEQVKDGSLVSQMDPLRASAREILSKKASDPDPVVAQAAGELLQWVEDHTAFRREPQAEAARLGVRAMNWAGRVQRIFLSR